MYPGVANGAGVDVDGDAVGCFELEPAASLSSKLAPWTDLPFGEKYS
jgi:hypothetical protein